MRTLLVIPFVLLVALVAYGAYVADQWLGVVAFTYRYLLFCIIGSLALGAVWFGIFRKRALLVVLAVFSVLAVNYLLPPPSERLLRSVMLKAPPGTEATAIVDIVKRHYEDSPYAMPRISEDRGGGFDRVHVSLLSQEAGNSTSVIFLVENGRVARSIFSPD
ncbi:MAG: hypothetical protein HKN82_00650 [Akkermansiaceae bacterium]|nr:hypothetical protein [Akkermansiaceae bacterium]